MILLVRGRVQISAAARHINASFSMCRVSAGSQSDAPHRSARLARVFSALCPVMAAVHLPLGCVPHLPLLSQKEQQRLHHDVHHEPIQNGERAACCGTASNWFISNQGETDSSCFTSFVSNRITGQTQANLGTGPTFLSPVQTQQATHFNCCHPQREILGLTGQ